MSWRLTDDIDEFAATAGDFLRSRPVEHTVMLTLIDTLRRRGPHTFGEDDPIYGWWRTPEGPVGGVLLQTPPHPMLFSALPAEAVPEAADAVASLPLRAVNLVADAEQAFAARLGRPVRPGRRTGLYRLETLTPPPVPPPGRSRVAGPADRDGLLAWQIAFHDEIGERRHADVAEALDDRMSYGGVLIWEDGGEPVSMAIRTRPEAGMVRVQVVYTPPERRGRGYAAGATVAATRSALDAGTRDVVLNTDLANPTSNRLYQRLGYRRVEDRVILEIVA